MSDYNFGQKTNGNFCACGEHSGTGDWSPDMRASCYAHERDKSPIMYRSSLNKSEYLNSYEKAHGRASPQEWRQHVAELKASPRWEKISYKKAK